MVGMSVDGIMSGLLSGKAYWKPETGECVFHDEVFDEPPENTGDTFTMTSLDLERARPDDIWAGYCSDSDRDIGREEAVAMIAGEPGWEAVL